MLIARKLIGYGGSFVLACLLGMFLNEFCKGQEKSRPCPKPEAAKDSKFHPGQVWKYKTRAHEKQSTVTILKIESTPEVGTIMHVRVDRVRLRNCTGGPEPDTFQHMPFTRDSIERSVSKLVKKDSSIPELQEGYEEWRQACGGVYTITVAEAVQVAEDTFNEGLGCKLQDRP